MIFLEIMGSIDESCRRIENQIKNGSYLDRLYFSGQKKEFVYKTSTCFTTYTNVHSESKVSLPRFERVLTNHKIKSIEDLLFLIHHGQLRKVKKHLGIF